MKVIDTIKLTSAQKECILKLWNQEYPEKLQHDDLSGFENYLSKLQNKEHLLLAGNTGEISGWAFTFTRDNEKWFAIILDSSINRLGYGTLLLNKLKDKETKLSGWVIDHFRDKKKNGEYYQSPLNFYLKNGFVVCSGIRLESDKISAVKIEWMNECV